MIILIGRFSLFGKLHGCHCTASCIIFILKHIHTFVQVRNEGKARQMFGPDIDLVKITYVSAVLILYFLC